MAWKAGCHWWGGTKEGEHAGGSAGETAKPVTATVRHPRMCFSYAAVSGLGLPAPCFLGAAPPTSATWHTRISPVRLPLPRSHRDPCRERHMIRKQLNKPQATSKGQTQQTMGSWPGRSSGQARSPHPGGPWRHREGPALGWLSGAPGLLNLPSARPDPGSRACPPIASPTQRVLSVNAGTHGPMGARCVLFCVLRWVSGHV